MVRQARKPPHAETATVRQGPIPQHAETATVHQAQIPQHAEMATVHQAQIPGRHEEMATVHQGQRSQLAPPTQVRRKEKRYVQPAKLCAYRGSPELQLSLVKEYPISGIAYTTKVTNFRNLWVGYL